MSSSANIITKEGGEIWQIKCLWIWLKQGLCEVVWWSIFFSYTSREIDISSRRKFCDLVCIIKITNIFSLITLRVPTRYNRSTALYNIPTSANNYFVISPIQRLYGLGKKYNSFDVYRHDTLLIPETITKKAGATPGTLVVNKTNRYTKRSI